MKFAANDTFTELQPYTSSYSVKTSKVVFLETWNYPHLPMAYFYILIESFNKKNSSLFKKKKSFNGFDKNKPTDN